MCNEDACTTLDTKSIMQLSGDRERDRVNGGDDDDNVEVVLYANCKKIKRNALVFTSLVQPIITAIIAHSVVEICVVFPI